MANLKTSLEALNGLCVLTKSYYSIKFEYRDKIYIIRMMNKYFRHKNLEKAIEKCVLYISKAENIDIFPQTYKSVENYEKIQ